MVTKLTDMYMINWKTYIRHADAILDSFKFKSLEKIKAEEPQ